MTFFASDDTIFLLNLLYKLSTEGQMTKKTDKEMLLVGSKTKDALKTKGDETFNVSGETLDALNEHVYWLIEQAQRRCEANGRKTIRPYDILA